MASTLQKIHTVDAGFDTADMFDGDPKTPCVNKAIFRSVALALNVRSSTAGTGKATIKAFACEDNAYTNPTEIDYFLRIALATDNFDSVAKKEAGAGAVTAVGLTPADQYLAIVEKETPADKPFVYFQCVEGDADPVQGQALLICADPVYAGDTMPTALA